MKAQVSLLGLFRIPASLKALLFIGAFLGIGAARGQVQTGAEQMSKYLPLLNGKRVGLLVNQTSQINGVPLPDTMLSRGVRIVRIFAPEHGFRGTADAGAKVGSGVDARTGLPVVSLYGKTQKPTRAQLADVDILVYDIQDVGVRFYTFISTLQYAMEACADAGIPVVILDRPNPNGHYVDGPVLDSTQRSFVGLQPIPVVYGMTPGEYARMLLGERWMANSRPLKLTVIPCQGWNHKTTYAPPIPPSPNLKNLTAVLLYPSLCLFEGTPVSVGRGTAAPFTQWGAPDFKGKAVYNFTPQSTTGATNPPHLGRTCYGMKVASTDAEALSKIAQSFQVKWIIQAYGWSADKPHFFTPFFDKLAGTETLRTAIVSGKSEKEIRASWQPQISQFKKIRSRYLLYPDFE